MKSTGMGLGSLVAGCALTTFMACVGDNPEVGDDEPGGGSSGSVSGSSGSSGGGASSGGGSTSSGGGSTSSGGGSTSSGDSGTGCSEAPHCDGNDVVQCAERTACALGCRATANAARCATFDAQGPTSSADLLLPGLGDVTLANYAVDVTTGEIRSTNGGAALRQPNADPATNETKNNIAFRREAGIAIFVAKNIDLGAAVSFEGTQAGVINGSFADLPVAFVAQESMHVKAVLTLPCGVMGGGAGGEANTPGTGPGAGSSNADAHAGAGGGHGAAGPQGGDYTDSGGTLHVGAAAGPVHNATFDFVGGGGAGGGSGIAGAKGSAGGGGGAVLQLVAGQHLYLGEGATAAGINAGGCGGGISGFNGGQRGGGGGAGGFVALEAPIIHGNVLSGIAANGGSGSGYGGGNVRSGVPGAFSSAPAVGGGNGLAAGCHGAGGNGGAGTTAATRGGTGATGCFGGGSGGGVGRIRIASNTGEVTPEGSGAAAFFVSPSDPAQVKKVLLSAEP